MVLSHTYINPSILFVSPVVYVQIILQFYYMMLVQVRLIPTYECGVIIVFNPSQPNIFQ